MPRTCATIYDTNGLLCDRKLLTISTLIGQRYPELGLRLGLSGAELAEIRQRAPDNLQHQVFHTLAAWRRREGEGATLARLNEALKELGWISVLTQIRNTPENFYVVV